MQDLSLVEDGLISNILSFNLGVELGQLLALVLGILPAEYGMDPTGLSKRMGLTKLHQENVTEEKLVDKTVSNVTSDFLQKRDEKWRSDKINLTLPAKQGLEVKRYLKKVKKCYSIGSLVTRKSVLICTVM